MPSFRHARVLSAVAAIVAVLLLGGAVSASADDGPPLTTPGAPTGTSSAPAPDSSTGRAAAAAAVSCNYMEFCVSKDTYFNGPTFKFTVASSNWSAVSYVDLFNEDSSWRSRWTVPVVVYDGLQFSGPQTLCVNINWDVYYANGANDRGSSHKWDGRNSC